MSSISVAIIAHNEEECIDKALSSVSWADEIVVINCDSTDDTALICSRFNVDVHPEPNRVNLNINKNIAIDRCSSEWILVLDADEIIPYDLAGEIRLTVNEGKHDGYRIARRNHILGRWLKHGGQYPDWQLRLFRRTRGRFPEQHIHERIRIDGSIGRLKQAFDHYPYHDLNDMIRKNSFYARFEAQYLY
ncbi:glycosyltransferase family 2 protein, partial [bacterium]|nr:glycosyltransferase family 2 protein [bacterium]